MLKFTMGGHQIKVELSIRYLGLKLDKSMNFGDHVACQNGMTSAVFGRLMPYVQASKVRQHVRGNSLYVS